MKLIILLILSLNIFAGTLNTNQIEAEAISNLISTLKKDAWNRGHDQIEVESEKFDQGRFALFLTTEMIHMEEELLAEDIDTFNDCLNDKECSLYKINVSSEFYAGFGFDYHFVKYNAQSREISIQTFTGYNE